MNFYNRHIGDWVTATAHLSEVEECIYSRCLDQYYARETALPLDIERVCRLVRASSKEAKKAVAVVLEEFFLKNIDGWHQKRCDLEIAKFKEEEPLRLQKEENIKERKRRFNERRKTMFDALREVNIVPAWDVKMPELENLFEQHIARPNPKTGTPPRTSEERPTDKNGTTTHTHTHTQTPITNNQIDTNNSAHFISTPQASVLVDSENPKTAAGEICKALKAIGIAGVSPSHPELLALIDKGVTFDQFVDAGKKAREKQKGFPYLMGIVRGQLAEANAIDVAPGMPDTAWDLNGGTIIATGNRLGAPPWVEGSSANGFKGETFAAYTARVRAAIETEKGQS